MCWEAWEWTQELQLFDFYLTKLLFSARSSLTKKLSSNLKWTKLTLPSSSFSAEISLVLSYGKCVWSTHNCVYTKSKETQVIKTNTF